MTEDETVGWHHRLNEHESEQALGGSEGQGSPACCRPWGHKESDRTEPLNNNRDSHRGLLMRLGASPVAGSGLPKAEDGTHPSLQHISLCP